VALGNRLRFRGAEDEFVQPAISIARLGKSYGGASSPHWYSDKGLHRLLQCVEPETTTVRAVVADLGFVLDDNRRARDLNRDDAAKVLAQLQGAMPRVAAESLGCIGPSAFGNSYVIKTGVYEPVWLLRYHLSADLRYSARRLCTGSTEICAG
jgi:hypothetical protein